MTDQMRMDRLATPAEYDHHRRNLAGEDVEVHEDEPQAGYYQIRQFKGGPLVPCGIWWQGGELVAEVNGKLANALRIWTYAVKRPVSHNAYKQFKATGKWPNQAEVAEVSSNMPTDPRAQIELELADLEERAKAAIEAGVNTQDEADRLAHLREKIAIVGKRADALRVEEKQPHLEAGNAIQAKWKPLIDRAGDAIRSIRSCLTGFLARKEAEAEKEAEAKRAHEQALADSVAEQLGETEGPPVDVVAAPARKVGAGGFEGKKTGLGTVYTAAIVDMDKLFAAIREHADVLELFQKIANRAARAKMPLPGTEVKESRVAR